MNPPAQRPIGPRRLDLRWCLHVVLLSLLSSFNAAALPRDRAELAAFKRLHPCPVTGLSKGACPGYEIDHIKPLKCRGRDRPDNMQWLTIEDHKAKTKREAGRCNKRRR